MQVGRPHSPLRILKDILSILIQSMNFPWRISLQCWCMKLNIPQGRNHEWLGIICQLWLFNVSETLGKVASCFACLTISPCFYRICLNQLWLGFVLLVANWPQFLNSACSAQQFLTAISEVSTQCTMYLWSYISKHTFKVYIYVLM